MASKWEEIIKGTEVCRPANPMPIRFPWCLGMFEAKQLCEKYRGKMSIITSSEIQRELFSLMEESKYDSYCGTNQIWTGFSDESSEGHYTDINEMRPLEPTVGLIPFASSQPNGKTKENCAVAKIIHQSQNTQFHMSWWDYACKDPYVSSFCEIDDTAFIKMRGERTNILEQIMYI